MKILIVNCFEWNSDYPPSYYPDDVGQWFINAFGGETSRFYVWRIQKEEEPPPPPYRAVVIGGSMSSVYDNDSWIRRLEEYTRRWIHLGVPLLGVCLGHQIIAQVAGGRVTRNPKGWEMGVCRIDQNSSGLGDPLFDGAPSSFMAMQVHQDIVVELPPNAECLASSALSDVQSFRLGEKIRTIQFHPEFSPEHLRYILSPYQNDLEMQGVDYMSVLSGLQPTPESLRIFANFLRFFVPI